MAMMAIRIGSADNAVSAAMRKIPVVEPGKCRQPFLPGLQHVADNNQRLFADAGILHLGGNIRQGPFMTCSSGQEALATTATGVAGV